MIAGLKELEAENAWLKQIYAEERLKAEILNGALIKRVVRRGVANSRRCEITKLVVTERGPSVRLACEIFTARETCYRYVTKKNAENEQIADWLLRLKGNRYNWGFGLRYLYLRKVKGFKWNHMLYQSVDRYRYLQPRGSGDRLLDAVRAGDQGLETDHGVASRRLVIRYDDRPENVSCAIQNWPEEAGVALQYIEPGEPQRNADVTRFD